MVGSGATAMSCEVTGAWQSFSLFFSGFMALTALKVKLHIEVPQREQDVWFLDISKQLVSSVVSYMTEKVLFGAAATSHVFADGDDCERYFMSYLYGSLLGVAFNISILVYLKKYVVEYLPYQMYKDIMKFGYYGEPFSWNLYVIQLCLWVSIVLIGRFIVIVLFLVVNPTMGLLFQSIFSIFDSVSFIKRLLTIVAMPVFLTTTVVWIQDVFLKYDRAEEESQNYLVRTININCRCFYLYIT